MSSQPIDLLKEIFDKQRAFGGKFCSFDLLLNGEQARWRDVFLECIDDEISEIRACLPWKHWKSYTDFKLDVEAIRFEFIDMLHFVVSLALVEGRDSDWVYSNFNCPIGSFDLLIADISSSIRYYCYLPKSGEISEESLYSVTSRILFGINKRIVEHSESYQSYQGLRYLFYLNFALCTLYGMDHNDIYKYYMIKNKKNFKRQEDGY